MPAFLIVAVLLAGTYRRYMKPPIAAPPHTLYHSSRLIPVTVGVPMKGGWSPDDGMRPEAPRQSRFSAV